MNIFAMEDELLYCENVLLLLWGLWFASISGRKTAPRRARPESARTTMIGSFEVLKGLSWWPDGGAHGPDSPPIHPL